jgi:tetratricopeptide (TPR) repeat protein
MRGSLRGCLVAGAILFAAGGARAAEPKLSFPPCTTTPTDADRKAAQGAFLAGHGSFNEGDYPTAITYWRDAYRRDCTAHLLLVNLARAYELRGEKVEAETALETYLERKPDASDADQIRRRIDNLKQQIAADKTNGPAPAEPAPSATPPPAPPPPPAAADTQPASAGKSRSAVPLFVAGAGGVVAIIGLAVIGGGAAKISDAEKACPDRQKCPADVADQGNQGRAQEKTGGFLLGTGLVVGAGGLVWYLVQGGSSSQTTALPATTRTGKHTDIIPAVGAGFAGVAVNGTF